MRHHCVHGGRVDGLAAIYICRRGPGWCSIFRRRRRRPRPTAIFGVPCRRRPRPRGSNFRDSYAFDATAEMLRFIVREPFVSRVSGADIVFGEIGPGQSLQIISHMPQGGVIFSDGIESDFLRFDSGAIARLEIAEKKVSLVCH